MGPLFSALVIATVFAAALLAAFIIAVPFTSPRNALVYATAVVGGGLVGVAAAIACNYLLVPSSLASRSQVAAYLASLGFGFAAGGGAATLLVRRWRVRHQVPESS